MTLIVISILAFIAVLYLIIPNPFSNEWKGKYGEKLTEDELKKLSKYGIEGKVFRNVYLPKDNGETSEVVNG